MVPTYLSTTTEVEVKYILHLPLVLENWTWHVDLLKPNKAVQKTYQKWLLSSVASNVPLQFVWCCECPFTPFLRTLKSIKKGLNLINEIQLGDHLLWCAKFYKSQNRRLFYFFFNFLDTLKGLSPVCTSIWSFNLDALEHTTLQSGCGHTWRLPSLHCSSSSCWCKLPQQCYYLSLVTVQYCTILHV